MNKEVANFNYNLLLEDVKSRIQQGQAAALLAVNVQLSQLYWDIGAMVADLQNLEGYGTAVIPFLSNDIVNAVPEVKGCSERNLKRMLAFYRTFPKPNEVVPQPVAQLRDSIIWRVPWGHHALLNEKIKSLPERVWFMQQTIEQGWRNNVLGLMIKIDAHLREGSHRDDIDDAIHQHKLSFDCVFSTIAAKHTRDRVLQRLSDNAVLIFAVNVSHFGQTWITRFQRSSPSQTDQFASVSPLVKFLWRSS
jgi:hypothetical protein